MFQNEYEISALVPNNLADEIEEIADIELPRGGSGGIWASWRVSQKDLESTLTQLRALGISDFLIKEARVLFHVAIPEHSRTMILRSLANHISAINREYNDPFSQGSVCEFNTKPPAAETVRNLLAAQGLKFVASMCLVFPDEEIASTLGIDRTDIEKASRQLGPDYKDADNSTHIHFYVAIPKKLQPNIDAGLAGLASRICIADDPFSSEGYIYDFIVERNNAETVHIFLGQDLHPVAFGILVMDDQAINKQSVYFITTPLVFAPQPLKYGKCIIRLVGRNGRSFIEGPSAKAIDEAFEFVSAIQHRAYIPNLRVRLRGITEQVVLPRDINAIKEGDWINWAFSLIPLQEIPLVVLSEEQCAAVQMELDTYEKQF